MTASTFIRSFERSRRGLPTLILSDNGKTFEAAAKEIKSVVSSPEIQRYFGGVGVDWRFNIPRAPWWGGVFERLVRSTKHCLSKVLGQAKFSYDELYTALVEVEMVLNSRPLTYVSADDLEEPLTPSHLLVGRRLMSYPDHLLTADGGLDSDEEDGQNLNACLKHLNYSLNSFWKRWRRGYLLELREAHCHHRNSGESQLVEGDIVVVYTDNQLRSCWKLGRIELMIVGADGQKRAATVRVSNKGRLSTLNRPIQHLYLLEVVSHTDRCEQEVCEPTEQEILPEQPDPRPRSAATRARHCILAQAISGRED